MAQKAAISPHSHRLGQEEDERKSMRVAIIQMNGLSEPILSAEWIRDRSYLGNRSCTLSDPSPSRQKIPYH